MSLTALIENALAETPPGRPVWIALSGGLDSCLLLTLTVRAARRHPRPVYALHVNHGLQAAATDFERHCRLSCSRLGVPLFVERVVVDTASGRGVEGAAREARYAVFARRVAPGETLWLAQHRRDQAETFLLATLRGSGIRGLAGMPHKRNWQGRHVVRPWLEISRSELESEAASHGLVWVEDPSNADDGFDRNFLRRQVLPLLQARWPKAEASLAQAASHAGEADTLLAELAAQDVTRLGGDPSRLPVVRLIELSAARQRLLIRHSCERLGVSLPPAARLASLLTQLEAREDAEVHIGWSGGEARVWRGTLYLQPPPAELADDWRVPWDGSAPLMTPLGRFDVTLDRPATAAMALTVTPRRGGERLRLAGRGTRDLKRLLQEHDVPPWYRRRLAVVWQAGEVIAVLGEGLPEGGLTSEGWRLRPARVPPPA